MKKMTKKGMRLILLDIDQLKNTSINGSSKSTRKRARNKLETLRRDNYSCTKCGSKKDLTIHHTTKPKNHGTPNQYMKDNCITLCEKCHLIEHNPFWEYYIIK